MSGGEIEIVSAEQLGRLDALQSVAEAVFGRGQRAPGWFGRKLARERVEAGLSAIARERASGRVCGYALVGRPRSLEGRARGAGVGVAAELRGRGIGRGLLAFVHARAQAGGCTAIEFLAEPPRVSWYVAQGFAVGDEQLTLMTTGLGSGDAIACGVADEHAAMGPRASWSWLPEAWLHTPIDERAFVRIDDPVARLWLSREGRAWLVSRAELDDAAALAPVVDALRHRVAAGAPLLFYPCPADGAASETLLRLGCEIIQRGCVVRRAVG